MDSSRAKCKSQYRSRSRLVTPEPSNEEVPLVEQHSSLLWSGLEKGQEIEVEIAPYPQNTINQMLCRTKDQIPIASPELQAETNAAVDETLKSGWLNEYEAFCPLRVREDANDFSEEEVEDVFASHPKLMRRQLSNKCLALSIPEDNTIKHKRSQPSPQSTLSCSSEPRNQPCHDGSDMESDENCDELTTVFDKNIPSDDELDEPVRKIVRHLETEMDNEIDEIFDLPEVFEWSSCSDTFRGKRELFTGPTPGPVRDYDTPYDAFIDIWDYSIMERIINETNRYAKQTIDDKTNSGQLKPSSRLRRWVDINVDELYEFYAVLIFMGINIRACISEYWMKDTYVEMSNFRKIMSLDRYILFARCLHFTNNEELIQSNDNSTLKLKKLLPVIDHLNNKFSKLYNLHPQISLEESLTLFKGKFSWIQVIKTKSSRVSIKSFELCEARTGYLSQFKIYTGRDTDISKDIGERTTQIILNLLNKLHHRGHLVTMDNLYNSPALARHLKRLGFDCLGTLRRHRKYVPQSIKDFSKNAPKGMMDWYHSGDVSVLAWKDSKVVTMISTYHRNETIATNNNKLKPLSVDDYNHTIGGVDMKDQKLSMYAIERKRGIKWYLKLFRRLLNTSIHNAYIMFTKSRERQNLSTLTHSKFRNVLASTLVERHRKVPPANSINSYNGYEDIRLRRDILHSPAYFPGKARRKRCTVCYRKKRSKFVHSKCATCDKYMCFGDCWEEWHSLRVLKS